MRPAAALLATPLFCACGSPEESDNAAGGNEAAGANRPTPVPPPTLRTPPPAPPVPR